MAKAISRDAGPRRERARPERAREKRAHAVAVQIKLVPVNAPYFNGATCWWPRLHGLRYGNFHSDFIKKHVTVIGCPKVTKAITPTS
jgi:hypothetical protein